VATKKQNIINGRISKKLRRRVKKLCHREMKQVNSSSLSCFMVFITVSDGVRQVNLDSLLLPNDLFRTRVVQCRLHAVHVGQLPHIDVGPRMLLPYYDESQLTMDDGAEEIFV